MLSVNGIVQADEEAEFWKCPRIYCFQLINSTSVNFVHTSKIIGHGCLLQHLLAVNGQSIKCLRGGGGGGQSQKINSLQEKQEKQAAQESTGVSRAVFLLSGIKSEKSCCRYIWSVVFQFRSVICQLRELEIEMDRMLVIVRL